MEKIIPGPAVERIVAFAAEEPVVTRAALDGVVALFSEKIVVTASAFDSVFPFASQDGVRSIPANEVVCRQRRPA